MCTAQRWWTQSNALCQVSGFPICLLPYPPFRLSTRVPPQPDEDMYVDGKLLALKLIARGNFEICERKVDGETVANLENYLRRCKLGTLQLGRALALAELLGSLSPETCQHSKVMDELNELRGRANQELNMLRRKQIGRLSRREWDNRGSTIAASKWHDEPRRGAPPNNRATRPHTAIKREMPASPSDDNHVSRTPEESTLYAPAVSPALTANGLDQFSLFNEGQQRGPNGHHDHASMILAMSRKMGQSRMCGNTAATMRCGEHSHWSSSIQESFNLSSVKCSYDQSLGAMTFSI